MKKLLLVLLFTLLATPALAGITNTDGDPLTADDWEKIGNNIWRLDIQVSGNTSGEAIPIPTGLYGANVIKGIMVGASAGTTVAIKWHDIDVFAGTLADGPSADFAVYGPIDDDLTFDNTGAESGVFKLYLLK